MIRKIDGFMLTCDNCGDFYTNYRNGFSIFTDSQEPEEYSLDDGWIEYDGGNYCPKCYHIDDIDNISIKESKKQL